MGRGVSAGMVLLLLLLACASGCARRVPVTGEFDARRQVVVTLKDGSEIKGKITTGARVELTNGGTIYRGRIADLTEDQIVIEDARFIRKVGDFTAEQARLYQARHDLGEEPRSFTFQRADITGVEALRLDVLRTSTQALFWTLTGAVSAFLLGEKS